MKPESLATVPLLGLASSATAFATGDSGPQRMLDGDLVRQWLESVRSARPRSESHAA